MLARVSMTDPPPGYVASHCRSQPRLSMSTRSSAFASRARIGPERDVAVAQRRDRGRGHRQSVSRPATYSIEPGPQLGAEVVAVGARAGRPP